MTSIKVEAKKTKPKHLIVLFALFRTGSAPIRSQSSDKLNDFMF